MNRPVSSSDNETLYRTGDLVKRDREDGKLYFVGRKDHQIKHMGYRIELEEIEVTLLKIPNVDEVIAIHNINDGLSKITVIVATHSNTSVAFLKKKARELLPSYMVPGEVHFVDKMPKNANGKTDRSYLKSIYH